MTIWQNLKKNVITTLFVLLSVGLVWYAFFTIDLKTQASERIEPTVTTWQFMWMTADDLRISIAHDQVDLDNLKSALNIKEKLISEKSQALERVRCQDKWLAITDYCKNMNGLGK